MDVHSKEKELKKAIKEQEKWADEKPDKFSQVTLNQLEEQMKVVKTLLENEEQTNELRAHEHDPKADGDDHHGMDKNRHENNQINDLEREQRRLEKKLRELEGKWN